MRPPAPAPDPTAATAIEDLVRGLDPDQRAAFVLTQLLGLGYTDAAVVCGVPVGTIRSRVARAREQLVVSLRAADAV
jgi:RNA polymerase sigma-70 factor (ECF subfamily)